MKDGNVFVAYFEGKISVFFRKADFVRLLNS